jgi:hypothetical protein
MAKEKDIAELIRLITLQSELLEPNVPMFIQQMIANHKNGVDLKKIVGDVNACVRTHIGKISEPFDEVFTHDEIMLLISFYREIRRLVSFYKSEAMKKFSKNGSKLFGPLYVTYRDAMTQVFKDVS